MIRAYTFPDLETVLTVINQSARAYRGAIPADCFHSPYMSREELTNGIAQGIRFYLFEQAAEVSGVMGTQDVGDVSLIRHAYVRPDQQGQGIGAALLQHLRHRTAKPILVGAWADATWAIRFYQRHGFQLVPALAKDRLLQTYWTISPRQIETSVVLADQQWRDRLSATSTPSQA